MQSGCKRHISLYIVVRASQVRFHRHCASPVSAHMKTHLPCIRTSTKSPWTQPYNVQHDALLYPDQAYRTSSLMRTDVSLMRTDVSLADHARAHRVTIADMYSLRSRNRASPYNYIYVEACGEAPWQCLMMLAPRPLKEPLLTQHRPGFFGAPKSKGYIVPSFWIQWNSIISCYDKRFFKFALKFA